MSQAPTQVAGAPVAPAPPLVTTSTPEAPAIPAKFLNADGTPNVAALAKSYTELEKRMSAPPAPAAPTPAPAAAPPDADNPLDIPKPPPAPELAADATPQQVLSHAGLDPAAIEQKLISTGDIEPADYDALAKKGYPKTVVQAFIAGQVQQVKAIQTKAAEVVGGAEQLNNLRQWAAANLNDADKAFYSGLVKNSDTAIQGVEWLNSRYHAAAGATGTNHIIDGSGPSATKPMTRQEAGAATRDKRYAPTLSDGSPNPNYSPGFRQRVIESL